jgi:fibro-slime domain-containing protein
MTRIGSRVCRSFGTLLLATASCACSDHRSGGSRLEPENGGGGASVGGVANGSGASFTPDPAGNGGTVSLNVPDADTPIDAGSDANAAAQCNGKFTGYLRDFTIAQPDGTILDGSAAPPVAEALAGTNYASSADFEVADMRRHPATAAGKRYGADLGMVEAMLGADGTPTYAGGVGGTLTTTGPENFLTWFHDTPNVNLGQNQALQFERDPAKPNDPNAYYFDSATMGCGASTCPGFFPIDDQLLLNEGNAHNYHMTFELHLEFKYHAGQVFTFKGDDDLWVFIDRRLALDLGGIHNEVVGEIALDTLGLTEGKIYPLAFFWAERHVVGSNLRIETSLEVTNCGEPVVK